MARLRNTSGTALDLYAVAGGPDSFRVDADGEVEVPGDIVNLDDDDADYYEIGEGDDARHWAKSTWESVGGGPQNSPRARARTSTSSEE